MTKKDQIIEILESDEETPQTKKIAEEVDCSPDYVRQVKRDHNSGDDEEDTSDDSLQESGDSNKETSKDTKDVDRNSGADDTDEEDNSDVDKENPYSKYDSIEEFKQDKHSCGSCNADVNFGVTYCPSCGTNLSAGFKKALEQAQKHIEG